MLTGPDDVRLQGKTGSSRPTAKVTLLTQLGLRLTIRVDLRSAFLVGLFLDCGRGFFEPLFVIARKPFDIVGPHPQH